MAIRWKVHRGLGAPLGCPYKARVPVKVAGGPYGPPSAGFDPETARHASEALPVGATGRTVAAHRGLRRAGFAESSRWASTLPHFTLASRRQHGRIAVVTTSYGAWSSPIRAADVADGVSLTFPQLVPVDEGASEVWWTASRPAGSGCYGVACRAPPGAVPARVGADVVAGRVGPLRERMRVLGGAELDPAVGVRRACHAAEGRDPDEIESQPEALRANAFRERANDSVGGAPRICHCGRTAQRA